MSIDTITPDRPIVITEEGTVTSRGPESAPEMPPALVALVKHCNEHYKACSDSAYRQKKIASIEMAHSVYQLEPEYTDWPFKGASNLTLPFLQITVDNLEPRIVAGLLGKEPFIRFDQEGQDTHDPAIEQLQTWFNNELKNRVGVKNIVRDLVHTLLLEGTYYCRDSYDLKRLRKQAYGQQVQQTPVGPVATMQRQDYEKVDEHGRITQIPFSDVYIADDVDTEDKWQELDKGIAVYYTYGDLMRSKGKVGWKDDYIGPWLLGEKKAATEQTPAQTVDSIEVTGRELIPCLEYHITYPIYRLEDKPEQDQTDFREERVIVTFTQKTGHVLRILKLTDLNMENETVIRRVRLYAEAEKSYGSSVYEKLASVQRGGSDIFNNMINAAVILLIPWYFYTKGAGVPSEYELIPGHGIEVSDVQGILFPQLKINPAAFLPFLQAFINLWERIGSIGDYQQGRQGTEKRTATEVLQVIQEGNIKHNYSADVLKQEVIAIFKTLYDLYAQKQGNFQQYQAMMREGVNFTLTGSTDMANELIDRKTKEDLFTMLGNDPMMNPLKSREDLLLSYKIPPGEIPEWINPQLAQLVAVFLQNPEVAQLATNYVQQKQAALAMTAEGGKPGGPGKPVRQ